ncbi:ZN862-like protein [Mya arenaria]|uniref:ZN862-like protein n=1 Tax=Mya arenaria TaxID=6604 RepID=A0ABY7F0J9_MYAAR|nr:ZN862-like protein [Mya arenaria]
MVTFVQFYDRVDKDVKTVFLSIDNLLEEFDSANAQAITQIIIKTLTDFELETSRLAFFVSDGASVMTGRKNGVAAKLGAEVNSDMISIHCICHRLALACTDTLEEAAYFKQVQLFLVQLWKLFENSPKKLAVYFKAQTNIKSLQFTTDKSRVKASRRLKKTCQTRWLSFNSSVQAILKEYPAVLQALNELQSSDSASLGLLTKLRSFKLVSAVYILAEVLPHLDQLSKTFQLGTVALSQVFPTIQYTNEKLSQIANSMSPVKKLCQDISENGSLNILELNPSQHEIESMKSLCKKYTDALKKNIEARFAQTVPILSALVIFDADKIPSKIDPNFKSHGSKDMQLIAEYFNFDSDELNAETSVENEHDHEDEAEGNGDWYQLNENSVWVDVEDFAVNADAGESFEKNERSENSPKDSSSDPFALKSPLVFHKFCCKCEFLMDDSKNEYTVCKSDQSIKSNVSYFVEIPLLFQIQQLFQRTDFHLKLKHRFTRKKKEANNIEDIYDGKLYKTYTETWWLFGFLQ